MRDAYDVSNDYGDGWRAGWTAAVKAAAETVRCGCKELGHACYNPANCSLEHAKRVERMLMPLPMREITGLDERGA